MSESFCVTCTPPGDNTIDLENDIKILFKDCLKVFLVFIVVNIVGGARGNHISDNTIQNYFDSCIREIKTKLR